MDVMWCQNCGQDVPAVYSSDLSAYCCGRCQGMFTHETPSPSSGVTGTSNSPHVLHSVDRVREEGRLETRTYDAWGIEQELHHLDRRLRGGPPRRTKRPTPDVSPEASKTKPQRAAFAALPEWNWGVLAFGMMASLCGLALSGWSLFTREAELWNVGFPILAGGASGVFVGVLVQLERLGRQSSP